MSKTTFVARPGQVDFSQARWAPVVNCVVQYGDKVLLVKRSEQLNFYPGYWNGISGFLDDSLSLEEKVIDEITEELGIKVSQIELITAGQVFDQDEPNYHKTWIVHPVLVRITTDKILLDWEAQEYRWVTVAEAKQMKLLPGFERVLKYLLL